MIEKLRSESNSELHFTLSIDRVPDPVPGGFFSELKGTTDFELDDEITSIL